MAAISTGKPVASALGRGISGQFDYTEQAESASSVSTPVDCADEPFASDQLGDTVIQTVKVWSTDNCM